MHLSRLSVECARSLSVLCGFFFFGGLVVGWIIFQDKLRVWMQNIIHREWEHVRKGTQDVFDLSTDGTGTTTMAPVLLYQVVNQQIERIGGVADPGVCLFSLLSPAPPFFFGSSVCRIIPFSWTWLLFFVSCCGQLLYRVAKECSRAINFFLMHWLRRLQGDSVALLLDNSLVLCHWVSFSLGLLSCVCAVCTVFGHIWGSMGTTNLMCRECGRSPYHVSVHCDEQCGECHVRTGRLSKYC